MNPFAQLIRLANGKPTRPGLPAARLRMPELPAPVRSTKAATLIAYLQEAGPASTSTLSSLMGLESKLVWGLLKAPRERGQVRYADGMWSALDDYDGELQRELSTAAALLRRHGWTARAVQTWITTNHPAARPHNNPPPAAPAPHTGATMDASVIDRPSTTTEAAAPAVPTEPGTPFQGGFYAGQFRIGADLFALIVSPKADGDAADVAWSKRGQDIPGASSCCDGLANTKAMAEAGSSLALRVLQLDIGGFNDWYLPSRDELELVYRHLKPTAAANYASFRDGDNPSSAPVGYPYTEASPEQTKAEVFRGDGAEALEPRWYWASTQSSAHFAWGQGFSDGGQSSVGKACEGRARAVRRFKLNA